MVLLGEQEVQRAATEIVSTAPAAHMPAHK
jgi:hypothetical protein